MTEITSHIMLSGDEGTRINIEKLIVWALRRHDCIYEHVSAGSKLKITFNFNFEVEKETPTPYDSIISEFDKLNKFYTEPNIKLNTEQDIKQDTELKTEYDLQTADTSMTVEIEKTLLEDNKFKDSKIMGRSPNNTALFRNWIEEHKIKKFDTQEFVDAFACINKKKATKIISYQINKKTIRQIGINQFEVIKEIE